MTPPIRPVDLYFLLVTALMGAVRATGSRRLGRLLIPLFLYSHNLLARPTFYMSAYLESHLSYFNCLFLVWYGRIGKNS